MINKCIICSKNLTKNEQVLYIKEDKAKILCSLHAEWLMIIVRRSYSINHMFKIISKLNNGISNKVLYLKTE